MAGDAETAAGNLGWPSGGASTDAAADSARPSGGDAAGEEVGGGNGSTGAAANSIRPSKGDVAGAEVGAGDGSMSAAADSAQLSGGNAAGAEAGAGDGVSGRGDSAATGSSPPPHPAHRLSPPPSPQTPPNRRPGKEPTGGEGEATGDEEDAEEIPRCPHALPWTNYVSPLQTFWFQGGREKEALKEGFDDAADKAYATVDVKTRRLGRYA